MKQSKGSQRRQFLGVMGTLAIAKSVLANPRDRYLDPKFLQSLKATYGNRTTTAPVGPVTVVALKRPMQVVVAGHTYPCWKVERHEDSHAVLFVAHSKEFHPEITEATLTIAPDTPYTILPDSIS